MTHTQPPQSKPNHERDEQCFQFQISCLQSSSLLFLLPVETQHLLPFCLSIRHTRVRVHRFLKWNDLNLQRFQSSCFKTGLELVGNLRHLLRRQSITVNSKQPGEVVIEVDEAESHAGIPGA